MLSWIQKNVLPGLLVSFALLFLVFITGEAYFRLTRPFYQPHWPSRFDARVGFLFEPNTEVLWTNHLDFWVREKTNSLGFLDREHTKPSSRCHVAFVGDSFVEAAQVKNDDKVQVALESLADRERPDLGLTAAGFGYSGTGQANQLPFYEHFIRQQHPKLVVLVFVGNDFRNNSPPLESIANGWDPDVPPRFFFRKTANGIAPINIDAEWNNHLLPVSMIKKKPRFGEFARSHSIFYEWILRKLALLYSKKSGGYTAEQVALFKARFESIRNRDGYSDLLNDWNYDGSQDLDNYFNERVMPQVFNEAIDLTEHAIVAFKRLVEADGGRVVVLAASQLTKWSKADDPEFRHRQLERLRLITSRHGIGMIDQHQFIEKVGGDQSHAHFKHDGHWSVQGHQWAAGAVWEYLKANPDVCP